MRVVVIGGAGAIGSAVVEHYLNKGASVTAVCRNSSPSIGPLHSYEHPNLTVVKQSAQISELEVIHKLITLPGAVANARLEAMKYDEWDTVIDANLTSVFRAIRSASPMMADNSSITVVGSIVATLGGVGCANYASAKAGLEGLIRAAANEFAPRGIRVNLLRLGYLIVGMGARLKESHKKKIVETIPMKRFGSVEEAVEAIDFLSNATYMTGNILTVAGGLR